MIAVFILYGILFLGFLASFICYRLVFHSPQKGQNDIYRPPDGEQYLQFRDDMLSEIETSAELLFQEVSIQSRDDLCLTAHYYHNNNAAPIAICFHGYRATGIRDFSGGVQILLKLGMNVLLVDERAQGCSEGHTITFGIKERYDCLDWINYVRKQYGEASLIMLYGISMGAATVLMAAGLSLPENVKGIVADSPYDTPKEIICKVCRDMGLPDRIIYPFISFGARLFGHVHLSDCDVISAVKKTIIPILILHGEDDRFVPCEMSREIQKANPEGITLYTFPGAGHGISYIVDKARYIRIVSHFIRSCNIS